MKEHTVASEDDDIRLDRWFKRHYPGFPHALLEKQLRKGLVRVDGKKAKSSDRLQSGQVVKCPDMKLAPRPKPRREVSPQALAEIKKWVLYKDDRIIVINKPPGLAVQGGSKIDRSVDDLLDGLMFEKKERPKLTHRLDRDTSGVLVLARSAKAATSLMHFFSRKQIDKTYLALVNNLPDPLQGVIDLPLHKKSNPKANGTPGGPEGRDYEIVGVDEEGQKAITEYKVIDTLAYKFALVELKPLTGRMHQLRVHMQAIGCPIVGDHKYGGSMTAAKAVGVENILHLHARAISIPPFGGGCSVEVKAPLPKHMQKTFKALGLDVPK